MFHSRKALEKHWYAQIKTYTWTGSKCRRAVVSKLRDDPANQPPPSLRMLSPLGWTEGKEPWEKRPPVPVQPLAEPTAPSSVVSVDKCSIDSSLQDFEANSRAVHSPRCLIINVLRS